MLKSISGDTLKNRPNHIERDVRDVSGGKDAYEAIRSRSEELDEAIWNYNVHNGPEPPPMSRDELSQVRGYQAKVMEDKLRAYRLEKAGKNKA